MISKTTMTVAATGVAALVGTGVAVPALASGTTSGLASVSTAVAGTGATGTATADGGERKSPLEDVLAGLVTKGTLTQAKADAITKALKAERPQRVEGKGERKAHVQLSIGGATTAEVAKAAGVTEAELTTGLTSGKSLSAIAATKGVSKATLVQRLGALVDSHAAEIIDRKIGTADKDKLPDRPKMANPFETVLKALVAKGTITQADSDAVTKTLKVERDTHTSGSGEGKAERVRPGGPSGLPGGPGIKQHRVLGGSDDIAKLLGLSQQDLGTQLRSGKSLAEIATSKGVSRDALLAAVTKAVKADLATIVDRTPPQRPSGAPGGPGAPGESGESGSSASPTPDDSGSTSSDSESGQSSSGEVAPSVSEVSPV